MCVCMYIANPQQPLNSLLYRGRLPGPALTLALARQSVSSPSASLPFTEQTRPALCTLNRTRFSRLTTASYTTATPRHAMLYAPDATPALSDRHDCGRKIDGRERPCVRCGWEPMRARGRPCKGACMPRWSWLGWVGGRVARRWVGWVGSVWQVDGMGWVGI